MLTTKGSSSKSPWASTFSRSSYHINIRRGGQILPTISKRLCQEAQTQRYTFIVQALLLKAMNEIGSLEQALGKATNEVRTQKDRTTRLLQENLRRNELLARTNDEMFERNQDQRQRIHHLEDLVFDLRERVDNLEFELQYTNNAWNHDNQIRAEEREVNAQQIATIRARLFDLAEVIPGLEVEQNNQEENPVEQDNQEGNPMPLAVEEEEDPEEEVNENMEDGNEVGREIAAANVEEDSDESIVEN